MSATLYTSGQSLPHHNSFACLSDSDDENDSDTEGTVNEKTNNENNVLKKVQSFQQNKTVPQSKISRSDSITKYLKYMNSNWEDL
jgi:hypothetical protein